MTHKKCENFDFSQIGQVRCANDASFAAEQLCHRGQFIILLLKIENIIREMVHIDIDIFHQKNSIFQKCRISAAIGRRLAKILSHILPHVYYVW